VTRVKRLDINTGRAEALHHDCLRHLSRKTFACGADAVVFGADTSPAASMPSSSASMPSFFGGDAVVLRRQCRRSSAAMPSFFGVNGVVQDFSPALSDCRSAGL
jgi:hypothetical protein